MDYGLFIPIANNGWITSATSPQYMPTFDLNSEIVQKAEKYGFKFALSMIKLRGYGGETEYWDYALESFTLMAGLAAVTDEMRLYASVATPTLHPAMVARMAVTIDSIAPGRFGINIVAGWNKSEYEQMGVWPGDEFYDFRYDYAVGVRDDHAGAVGDRRQRLQGQVLHPRGLPAASRRPPGRSRSSPPAPRPAAAASPPSTATTTSPGRRAAPRASPTSTGCWPTRPTRPGGRSSPTRCTW